MDITIQLIVYIEIALVLQGRAASGAPETVNMQVLVLDPNEDTAVSCVLWVGIDGDNPGV